jgi:hypothetical protein
MYNRESVFSGISFLRSGGKVGCKKWYEVEKSFIKIEKKIESSNEPRTLFVLSVSGVGHRLMFDTNTCINIRH